MVKVLVVGAGMTGASAAALLRQRLPTDSSITVWDKARGAGGRMSTSRSSSDDKCTVDLGAQYITLIEQYQARRQELYLNLVQKGILAPMTGNVEGPNRFDEKGAKHYVTPQGIGSLVKHFLNQAEAKVEYNRQVVSVDVDGKDTVRVADISGNAESFQAVVLTMPVPQILQLRGSIQKALDADRPVWDRLLGVTYSSRYALGLFYPAGTELPYQWCSKYISDDPCIRYVAVDNKKRNLEDKTVGPSVCVHTHVQFGLQHIEQDKEQVKKLILQHLRARLPELPEPTEVKSQKWRYSQVYRGYPGRPGCVTLQREPLIVLGGDAFSLSSFDGCLDSAEAVASAVTNYLKL
ncbi:hypothetical protein C0Q70_01996 [Pomacea canaliculata]|uniref:Amine oxidase domain-containing protein n=2 Tax=Pomacea canaliculata TaxID=400727 RepID=A0A2T7Q115_POMCA|nr:hypothetical protein C0Q70_01996 [Pomacea canaliculata]